MAGIRVSMDVGGDGVAVITISNSLVNALHPAIISGLKEKYTEAMNRGDVKAIVLTVISGLKEKCTEAMNRDDVKGIVLTSELSSL